MATQDNSATPYTLTHTLSNAGIHQIDKQIVRVRGIYSDIQRKLYYDGYYYDRFVDELKGCWLTLKVPEVMKPRLKDGTPYEIEGTIERRIIRQKELSIYLSINLSNIIGEKPPIIDSNVQEKANILRARYAKPRHDIDLLLGNILEKRRIPRIAMMFGADAITEADITHVLKNRRDKYEFVKFPISLANRMGIIGKLQELDKEQNYDLIVIYRGGGSGLEIFDDVGIAQAVVSLNTAFVTAIGHAADTPFIQDVADRAFTTPTDFGTYLKEIADKHIKEAFRLKKYHEQKEEYLQTIANLRAEKDTLQNEILLLSHSQQAQMPAQVEAAFNGFRRRVVVWVLITMLCGAGIEVAASYAYESFFHNSMRTAAPNAGGSTPNEQAPRNASNMPAINNSQNVNKKRRGG